MTSMERVMTALQFKEPDRVPLFLLLTMHGARELGMSIRDYFSSGENVALGQMMLLKKYGHDCVYPFFYAPVEVEARGGEVIYRDDGPPNSGEPIIKKYDDIMKLKQVSVKDSPPLVKVLKAIELLKSEAGDQVPIIGVVMSPFSVPVMQMGFDRYIELMYENEAYFNKLMEINEEFCVEWANAQLDAGAAAICYFDPVSSTSIIPRSKYLETGFKIAKRTIGRIKGPTATHMASGRCFEITGDLAETGTAAVGVSVDEDLSILKSRCRGRLSIIGNLNGIEMRRWSAEKARDTVRQAIVDAGAGGGFILSDNHGEIPFQVPEEVLFSITEAVEQFGYYPLNK